MKSKWITMLVNQVALCALVALASRAAAQTTVYSTVSTPNGYVVFPSLLAAAWSQTSTFSDVSIAAAIDGGGGSMSGTAYLMTQIGPGTTTANELGRYNFTASSPQFQPTMVTLFSGLTLGPGTYYLVLSGDGGGWETTGGSLIPAAAPGVTTVNRKRNSFFPIAAYPPATPFQSDDPIVIPGVPPIQRDFLQYSVTSVPEPGGIVFCAVALSGWIVCRRRT